MPQSTQKQLPSKPLDTQPLQLPTNSTTRAEVEVSATYLVAKPPRPSQEPFSSMEAELRCSAPKPPTHGEPICAPHSDAGSPTTRKTRLRLCLPEYVRRQLGVYAAPEPVIKVSLLLLPEPTFMRLPRAERELQLVLASSPPSQPTISVPISLLQCPRALHVLAVLRSDSCTVVRNACLHKFDWIVSCRDSLRWLQSLCDLPAHARHSSQHSLPGSAHQRPPAQDAPTAGMDAGPQSTTQPPLPAHWTQPLPLSSLLLGTTPTVVSSVSAMPQSTQKQLPSKPLDTQPLQLPTNSTTTAEVEVSATYLVAKPPRPSQEPFSSMEAELRCSAPKPLTHGEPICAPHSDAGSPTTRKTRLRLCLPEYVRRQLGVYVAPEPVIKVSLLLLPEPTFMRLPRAERELQLVLASSPPSQPTISVPISLLQCPRALHVLAVLRSDSCTAVRNACLHKFDWIVSCRDSLRWLQSLCDLPAHARHSSQHSLPGSAHQRPPAQDAPTAGMDAGPQSTTQPPLPAHWTQPLPLSSLPRVRIDPHSTGSADEPSQ